MVVVFLLFAILLAFPAASLAAQRDRQFDLEGPAHPWHLLGSQYGHRSNVRHLMHIIEEIQLFEHELYLIFERMVIKGILPEPLPDTQTFTPFSVPTLASPPAYADAMSRASSF